MSNYDCIGKKYNYSSVVCSYLPKFIVYSRLCITELNYYLLKPINTKLIKSVKKLGGQMFLKSADNRY